MVYYLYNDEDLTAHWNRQNHLQCSTDEFRNDGQIDDITFLVSPIGDVYPEEELPLNDRTLKGFVWRITERTSRNR